MSKIRSQSDSLHSASAGRKFQVILLAAVSLTVIVSADDNEIETGIFFSKDVSVSGALASNAVTNVDTCWATGSAPQAFTSQAP